MKVIAYKLYEEYEGQKIYTDIEGLSDGVGGFNGWMATTGGTPITAEDTITDAEDAYKEIMALIARDSSNCEFYECREATEEDYEYVDEWLNIWGIKE